MGGICVGGRKRCRGRKVSMGSNDRKPDLEGVRNFAGCTTFGSLAGFFSALFVKKAGQAAGVTLGGIFALFQLAAYAGYVRVNWPKIESDSKRLLDLNRDGKVNQEDVHVALENTVGVLSHNMGASGAGFAAGFFLGLKR